MKKIITLIMLCLVSYITRAQTWSAVGNGVDGRISCFAIYNGELYAGGQFIGLMRWNGTEFDTVPGTYLSGIRNIRAMEVYKDELYIGGIFSSVGSSTPSIFEHIVRWNGSSFSSVGTGCSNTVFSMNVYNGNLYVGGFMKKAGSVVVNSIGKWDGSQWSALGDRISSHDVEVFELVVYKNELYAAGNFRFKDLDSWSIARWNGTTWNEVGSGVLPSIYALGTYDNELYALRPNFTQVGGFAVDEIAKWDGTIWAFTGGDFGINGAQISGLMEYHNELYVGGKFSSIDGISMNNIGRYNGLVWNAVIDSVHWSDTMYINPTHEISAFIEFNDDLYVAGIFDRIGGITAHNVAKWNTPLGIEKLSPSQPIFVFPNPTTNKVTVACYYLTDFYKVHDASGKLVLSNNTSTKYFEIDLQDFANGIYILSVGNKQKQYHTKIVKL